jgi:SAM-dependent methyltransferase
MNHCHQEDKTTIDYGLDGPGWLVGFAAATVALAALALTAAASGRRKWAWRAGLATIGTSAYVADAWWTSRIGKLQIRDQILDWADLQAEDTVLDVGCGRGLLAIGCARRLPRGWVLGLDRWRQWDQWNISAGNLLANARRAQVADRIAVVSADARAIPCADASFSCVVSSLVIHNLSRRADRRRALEEMYRVLKPGGRLVMFDVIHSGEYPAVLQALGADIRHVHTDGRLFFMPGRLIVAQKPTP